MVAANAQDLSAATKSQYAAQLDLCTALNAKALDSAAKLIDLNMRFMQDVLTGSMTGVRTVLSPANAAAPFAGFVPQAGYEDLLAYGQSVADILLDSRIECTRLVQESVGETNRKAAEFLDELARNVPDNAGAPFDLLRVSFNTASSGLPGGGTAKPAHARAKANERAKA